MAPVAAPRVNWAGAGLVVSPDDEEAFPQQTVRKYSLLQIRAEVLNIPYGQEARHRVLSEGDTQIQSALGLFGKAAELQAQRRELPPRVDRADADPKGKM